MSAVRNALLAAALSAATLLAHAGRSCEAKPLQVQAITQGMALAQRTAEALDRSGAQVLVLARAGQDLSRYGLRYSHLGFVYRDAQGWRVLHKLNQCGTAEGALYRQGLGEFFMDNPFRYEATVVALQPALQARLLPLLRSNERAAQLNERRYNMLAYPWSTTYQQSNQWAIETLAMAAAPNGAPTRLAAQAWLQQQGYQPTTLHLGPLTRLGARATAANIAFDDHPDALRFSDRINTVTVDSVLDWLARTQLGAPAITVY
jgi:hypothetical protein